jgi:hypothetical protein
VHLRRAVLLFALVLGLTALAAAVSPSRNDDTATPAVASGAPAGSALPRTVTFLAGDSAAPQVRRARAGEHLLLTVSSSAGGLVTIPSLGRTSSVSDAAPARFDVLAPDPGRYDILLKLSGGPDEPSRVGTLVTRP